MSCKFIFTASNVILPIIIIGCNLGFGPVRNFMSDVMNLNTVIDTAYIILRKSDLTYYLNLDSGATNFEKIPVGHFNSLH